jgi:molybdenum cofactor cytidylyltransferase
MSKLTISGVLLSAGESRRMGTSKALLKFGSNTNIENLINEYLDSDLDEVIVVVGFKGEELKNFIESKFQNEKLKVLINRGFELGMLSSIQKGIEKVLSNGILIGIVDNPLTSRSHIAKLIDSFDGENIVLPSFRGQGGHPIIIPAALKNEILESDPENTSLKDVILKYKDIVRNVEFDDESITFDMDNYEDYQKLLLHWKNKN